MSWKSKVVGNHGYLVQERQRATCPLLYDRQEHSLWTASFSPTQLRRRLFSCMLQVLVFMFIDGPCTLWCTSVWWQSSPWLGKEESDERNCSSMGMFALTSSVQPRNSGGEAALAHTLNLRSDDHMTQQWSWSHDPMVITWPDGDHMTQQWWWSHEVQWMHKWATWQESRAHEVTWTFTVYTVKVSVPSL